MTPPISQDHLRAQDGKYVPDSTRRLRRDARRLAALTATGALVAAGLLALVGPANAVSSTTCLGSSTNTYSPGPTFTPRTVHSPRPTPSAAASPPTPAMPDQPRSHPPKRHPHLTSHHTLKLGSWASARRLCREGR